MSFNSRLYAGQVYHRRTKPREHRLSYSVFTLLIDLSELDELAASLWLFSRNGFNLFSFHDQDVGEGRDESLEAYAGRKLRDAGIREAPAQILLSCYPRVLGLVFNPLSLFYCIDADGHCFAVIHEVHNTFGERHSYVLPVQHELAGSAQWIHQAAEKALFVSPFAHMGMHYEFRLNLPAERQVVVIRASDADGLVITASYSAQRRSLTAGHLARYFITCPMLGIKVYLGIHWEALRLWYKGVPWFRHQPRQSR